MLDQLGGDFWSEIADAYVITTNGTVNSQGRCVMGRGIALQAKNRFPGIDLQLGRLIKHWGNRVHYLGPWTRADGVSHNIFSFPVKHAWNEKADLELIKKSAEVLAEEAPTWMYKIVMVRPGCGNGGLSWDDVKPAITPFLNQRFIVIERNP